MKMAFAIALLGILAIGGSALLAWAVALFLRGQRTHVWPSVEGSVFRAWVLQKRSNVGRRNPSGRAQYPIYTAEVEYDYTVAGHTLRGSRAGIGVMPGRSRSEAEAQVAQWPENARVRVYYDPLAPSSSVLVPGPAWPAILRFAAAGAFLLGISGFLMVKLVESGLLES